MDNYGRLFPRCKRRPVFQDSFLAANQEAPELPPHRAHQPESTTPPRGGTSFSDAQPGLSLDGLMTGFFASHRTDLRRQ
jgi:hypothetical protein